ncbi:uncharacterized protein [Salminus brasiliensis]|uniref:uncharacterized protein n=1 Tax=Salminus brasiliensis TaxID=930266 RepID=UPI003B82D6AA
MASFMTRILIFLFYIMCSAEAEDVAERVFISAESDKPVTLDCKAVKQSVAYTHRVWYKQILGQEPQEVATRLQDKSWGALSPGFDALALKLHNNFSLTIEKPTKAHEGMYYCGRGDAKSFTFTNVIFVAVADHSQSLTSVTQSPEFQSVSPGEPVNLQCTVHSKVQAAELRVLWFRSAAGRSFPEIIYTHHNSSRQCEISSSKDGCVFSFSKNINNSEDTGTYYCAVSSCGKIIVGNGATVDFKKPVDLAVIFLGAALGVCVVVIAAQSILICKGNCKHCSGELQQCSVPENSASKNRDAVGPNYASVQFKEKNPRSGRGKREQPEHIVYSQVRSSTAAQRSHR